MHAGPPPPHFFPSRPAIATTLVARGTLLSFGIGNDEGSFSIRTATGRVRAFYVGYPLRVDGAIARCLHPPEAGFAPSREECPAWPRDLAVGRSRVVVRYWNGPGPDGRPAAIGTAIDADRRR